MIKQILRLAIPSIMANITVPLVGIVDLAIAGHISDAATIGGIAVGTMLFDLLYWNLGFLRVGTGGMTAQAFGRGDRRAIADIFVQSITLAIVSALFIFVIAWPFVDAVMMSFSHSAEVETFARQYFNVRIWAAPATLSLMVFKGWFIGMQNTVRPMVVDITVNVVNIISSYLLAVHTPMGAVGVAYGTLIAQYAGLAVAMALLIVGYRDYIRLFSIRASIRLTKIRELLMLNGHLILRSLGFMVVYVGFTIINSHYDDTTLAVGAIMMKLLMLFSFFIDGFAYAGEALVGRYIGARDCKHLDLSVKRIFMLSGVVALVFTLVYMLGGEMMVRMMTSDSVVVSATAPFLFWLTLMPAFSCAAFVWDGIYVGATAGPQIRNSMLLAALAFLATYFALQSSLGVQALYTAYFMHLVVRALYLSARWRKVVLSVKC